jgi:energy-coupling factor transporter ATP-binding protein EcfA2
MSLAEQLGVQVDVESTNAVVDLDTIKDDLLNDYRNGGARGEMTHFKGIDDQNMFTWKKGLLYVFTGHSGHGKSEFLNELTMLKAIHDNWVWTIYSPESYPIKDFVSTLIQMYIGKPFNPFHSGQMSEAEMEIGFNFIKKHYRICDFEDLGLVNYQKVLDQVNDTDGIVIDPFNYMKKEHQNYSDNLMEVLSASKKKASRRHEERVVVYVEHPNSGVKFDDNGNIKEVTEFDLNGGAMWKNKCDFICTMLRNSPYDSEDTSAVFKTRKIKNQKLHGIPNELPMRFDRMKNRYLTTVDTEGGRYHDSLSLVDNELFENKKSVNSFPKSDDEPPF